MPTTATDHLAVACHQQQLLAQANCDAIHCVFALDMADPECARLAIEAVAIVLLRY